MTTFGYGSSGGAGGDLVSITNTGGAMTTFGYDSAHRVTSVTRSNPGGTDALTRFAYPSATQTLVAGPNTNPAQPITSVPRTTYTLTSAKRVSSTVDPLGRTQSRTYTSGSDIATATSAGGGVTTGTYGANYGESLTGLSTPTGVDVALSYSGSGTTQYRPTGTTDPQGNQAVLSYDTAGNPISTTNSATTATASVTYHSDGTLATSTDPAGKVTTYTRDAATHQITGITPPTGSGLGSTTFSYDGYTRPSSVTDGRGATATIGYDNLDRVTSITYSGPGVSTPALSYAYDTAGNLQTRTDATGTTTFGWDKLGRLTARVSTAGGGTLSYGYDPAGNLTSRTNARGTTSYVYDAANQLTQRTTPGGMDDTYAYNADGKRTDTWSLFQPDVVAGQRHVNGTAEGSGAASCPAVEAMRGPCALSGDPVDRPGSQVGKGSWWRTNPTWAAHTHTDYDAAGRVTRTWTSRTNNDATRVFDTSYCYSPDTGSACPTGSTSTDTGLIQWSVDNLTGAKSTYSYDGANRVTGVTNYGGHTYTYAYDSNGNRTTTSVDGTTTQTLGYNSGNQITNPGYSYDAAGNRTQDPSAGAVTYNTAGQMTATSGTTYTYAGPGQNELTQQSLPGSVTYNYVYGVPNEHGVPTLDSLTKNGATTYLDNDPVTGEPTGMYLPIGQADYFVKDGLGAIRGIISGDDNGKLVATYTYDPYGAQVASTGTGAAATINPYRHTAGLRDPATTWNRHGFRYHDTASGQWTTPDPIRKLNDPNEATPYIYAAGNPVNNIDPLGLRVWTDLVGGAVGLAAGTACAVGTALLGTIVCGAAGAVFGLGVTYSLNFLIYGEEVQF